MIREWIKSQRLRFKRCNVSGCVRSQYDHIQGSSHVHITSGGSYFTTVSDLLKNERVQEILKYEWKNFREPL